MNNERVSIIVPVYNAEEYINECLNSIKNQTYSDFEVIIIDDGSTDQSLVIAEEYKAEDYRFKIFSQDNKGSSAARNAGLRLAKGEYIAFVDADDWIEKDFLEILVKLITDYKADIAVCDFDRNGQNEGNWSDGLFDRKQAFHEYLNIRLFNRIMNKLYRSERINGIFFPEGRNYMEDAVWTACVIDNIHCVVRTHEALYHYRYQEKSISHIKKKKASVLCGKFRNNIDREIILFNNIDLFNDEDRDKYAAEIIDIIDELFRLSIDLDKYDIFLHCKKIVKETKHLLLRNTNRHIDRMLIRDILREKAGKPVQRKHRMRVLCSLSVPIKEKAAIFYRDMNIIRDI